MQIKPVFFIILILLTISLCSGMFYEVSLTGAGKDKLISLLLEFSNEKISAERDAVYQSDSLYLLKSLLRWLPFLILAFLSLYINPLSFLLPIFMMAKGFSLGFCLTLNLESLGISGILHNVLYLIPCSLLQLSSFLVISSISITLFFAQKRNKKRALPNWAKHSFKAYLACIILIIISCILEVYLHP